MNDDQIPFRTGVIRPVECIREGWRLIKKDYWLFLGLSVVAAFIGGAAPFGILLGPMMCGVYMCLLRQTRNEKVSFELLFKGFDHFVQSLIATLIMIVPIMIIGVVGYVLMFVVIFASMPTKPGAPPDPNAAWTFIGAFSLFMLLMLIVSMAMSVLFFFIYPLIVDRKLQGIQAIKTSVAAARANLGGVLGLVLLNGLMTFAGLLACYVGAFFVMPIHFAAVLIAYRQVFPALEESNEPDQAKLDYDELPAEPEPPK